MSTEHIAPTGKDHDLLVSEMREWQRRKRWAFVVRVVTTLVSLVLLGAGVALLLGQINSLREDYVPKRHPPGASGSISIMAADTYVAVKHDAPLPECTVTQVSDDYELLQEPWSFGQHPEGISFYAEEGRHTVFCEGGQDGVVVLNRAEYENSLMGPWDLRQPAYPMLAAGLLLFFGGKAVAARIRPESKRPVYPA